MATHVPVLLAETLDQLAPALESGGWCVDCTVGLGGHAAAVLERFGKARLLAVDRDQQALASARERLAPFGERVRFSAGPFGDLEARLRSVDLLGSDSGGEMGVRGLLADLGVSSMQLDTAERGFSFQYDGPLDMRMAGQAADELSAADIVNGYPEEDLAKIIKRYGEERQARRIARGIALARRERPIETTGELASVVAQWKRQQPRPRGDRRRVHPATQTFQALRIEVNRELEELEELLDQAVRLLDQDGRLVVISYHSLEDRIVKHTLRDHGTPEVEPITGRPRAETQVIEVLTRKPVRPQDSEIASNPRARSARLRSARRL